MYTSPDLRSIRERIQINDQPIVKELFTEYFFEVWNQLSSQQQIRGEKENMPRFLQLLAILAFHTFIREKTEVVICETHHGGEYDATNVIQKPIATGITSIGMDHIAQLGPTIENVAWHKAGIFKVGTPAFSVPQDLAVTEVLQNRAAEKGVELKFIEADPTLPCNARTLRAPVQRINCSLALALTGAFLNSKSLSDNHHLNSDDIVQGVERFSWPGRFEVIVDGSNRWFLDGAHNELSVTQAAEWFSKDIAEIERYGKLPFFSY
jgi:folylpolyglutamate synthase